jgi:hypothetical protein
MEMIMRSELIDYLHKNSEMRLSFDSSSLGKLAFF